MGILLTGFPKDQVLYNSLFLKNELSVNSEKSVLAHVFAFCCLIYYFVGINSLNKFVELKS